MTVVDFLLARYDDVEAWARENYYADDCQECAALSVHEPRVVTRQRILAGVAAKRRILDLHERRDLWAEGPKCPECSFEAWPCDTVRALATEFADHPDYREDWDE